MICKVKRILERLMMNWIRFLFFILFLPMLVFYCEAAINRPPTINRQEVLEVSFDKDKEGFPYAWKYQLTQSFTGLVEAGKAIFGSSFIREYPDRIPAHERFINPFVIAKKEVSVGQYKIFLENADGYNKKQWWSEQGWEWKEENSIVSPLNWSDQLNDTDAPLRGISFFEAEAFCQSLGLRLPTEMEWERAARGLEGNYYSWGECDQLPNDDLSRLNQRLNDTMLEPDYVDFDQSPAGCNNMMFGVHEWTSTILGENDYDNILTWENNYGPARIIKGGSYRYVPYLLTLDARLYLLPDKRNMETGFRPAANSPHQVQQMVYLYAQEGFQWIP